MRRVAITGLGIVSPIGCDTGEVTGRSRRRDQESSRPRATRNWGSGVRCTRRRRSNGNRGFDRRAARFLASGTAYGHIAMEQAIADAGLADDEVSNDRTGLIVGSGGPSTRAIVEAADIAREARASSGSARSRCPRR